MDQDKIQILIGPEEIMKKVRDLGQQISRDYAGKELLVVGILKGAIVFMADLIRQIDLPLVIDFMDISSYGNSAVTSGEVRIIKDLEFSIYNQEVLIVEDIVDTGLTLGYILDVLKKREPKSIKICCLLDKPSRRKSEIKPDYVGFVIDDEFVVGYGLDYAENYRNHPAVCILEQSVYEEIDEEIFDI